MSLNTIDTINLPEPPAKDDDLQKYQDEVNRYCSELNQALMDLVKDVNHDFSTGAAVHEKQAIDWTSATCDEGVIKFRYVNAGDIRLQTRLSGILFEIAMAP